jgi:serine/threonine protein kinase
MTPETWRRVGELFAEIMESSPGERQARLERHDVDPLLRREVERLLAHDRQAQGAGFLTPGTWNVKAHLTRAGAAGLRFDRLEGDSEKTRLTGGVPSLPHVGERIDDFELLGELGRGASGVVFLARQVSLNRLVALKATANRGDEGRTMASLEHRHIVAVYSERVIAADNLRLLCMQYVPGAALDAVLCRLRGDPPQSLSGERLLEVVDEINPVPAPFEAQAVRERESLANSTYVEAVCWIMARLAEALDYAHRHGVVHRDIKPANILLDAYGRPLLADFSISARGDDAGSNQVLGGTLPYMAPEHLDAFGAENSTGTEAVDERSDIYSLGVVLYEALALARPFDDMPPDQDRRESLVRAAERRRGGPRSLREIAPQTPEVVERAVRRCLEGAPAARFPSAAEVGEALDGCRSFLAMQERLPPTGRMLELLARRPFLSVTLLCAAAHLAGNIFTPLYNALLLFPSYTAAQERALVWVVVGYGLTVFPLTFAVTAIVLAPRIRVWRDLQRGQLADSERIHRARRDALFGPAWSILIACVGWWPLLAVIPWALGASGAPLPPGSFGYFFFSILLSWLGAAAWSYFVTKLFVLRIFYPRLWPDAREYRLTAPEELRGVGWRLRVFPFLLGMSPLAVAIMMVLLGPDDLPSTSARLYRILVVAAIIAGIVAFQFAIAVTRYLERTVAALAGGVAQHNWPKEHR